MTSEKEIPERMFCDYSCEHARANKDVPSCHTINPIYCTKHDRLNSKSGVCFDRRRK